MSSIELLSHIEPLGAGASYAQQIFDLVGRSPFFAEFERDDIELLAAYMTIYNAQPGQAMIREGDEGDFMLLIISGAVDIFKYNTQGERQLMTSVGPGMTLGEMSMIDGEPRFATCIATDAIVFAVLTRDAMANIILEKPSLGAKLLIKLVTMLSQRLRQTSARLLQTMERAPLAF
ncbi:MAG: cyclic nucleotide-binding domain-containing protein [Burkholderiales bacterium]|nr:cyclic nucleotide-binding domain-containing protein [Burkholderiales bacterium]